MIMKALINQRIKHQRMFIIYIIIIKNLIELKQTW